MKIFAPFLICLLVLLSSATIKVKKERLRRIDSLESYMPAVGTILTRSIPAASSDS